MVLKVDSANGRTSPRLPKRGCSPLRSGCTKRIEAAKDERRAEGPPLDSAGLPSACYQVAAGQVTPLPPSAHARTPVDFV